jgi:ABC-type glycerol-3-phosphate transport system substrate-binding protein
MKSADKFFAAIFFASLGFFSCRNSASRPIVVWTDNPEIVSYVELFNATHDDINAVVVYKEEPARALPPAKDELTPDVIIAPWLKNSSTRKYFAPMNYLFAEKSLDRTLFYDRLLQYGEINEKQYLLPVSFNLPAMIFSQKNLSFIETNSSLNLEQIKSAAANFNQRNKSGNYTAMGFAPSWDDEFLYLVTKLYGASYREKGASFLWDEKSLGNSVMEMRQWTLARNTDTSSEQNFQFKYLYMPGYRQITTGRCLFAYTTSDVFFMLNDSQLSNISFRWIEQDGKIPVEDDIITMGLYKKSEQKNQAEIFISWFMKVETQRLCIQRSQNRKTTTAIFGIAGGFSSLKEVNEKFFPAVYRKLLGNTPQEQSLTLPNILPYRWKSLKTNVIIPYLKDEINTSNSSSEFALQDRIAEWTKQFY